MRTNRGVQPRQAAAIRLLVLIGCHHNETLACDETTWTSRRVSFGCATARTRRADPPCIIGCEGKSDRAFVRFLARLCIESRQVTHTALRSVTRLDVATPGVPRTRAYFTDKPARYQLAKAGTRGTR